MKRLSPIAPRAFLIIMILFLAASAVAWAQGAPKTKTKKVAMIIPFTQYDITEFKTPKDIFEKAGIKVSVVASQLGTATAEDDQVNVDLALDQLKVQEYDAIIFVGGYGVPELIDNETAHAIVQKAVEQKKILAAICWAPVILAKAGVLKGKKFTASTDIGVIRETGGEYVIGSSVVVDGNIITGHGPGSSEEFGATILEKLKKLKK